MNTLRALALIACVALAACTAPASQQPQTRRTGGNLPPEPANYCVVDEDCNAKPQCKDAECRCVRNTCIAKRDALNPSIDPAPASSVR